MIVSVVSGDCDLMVGGDSAPREELADVPLVTDSDLTPDYRAFELKRIR